MKKMLALLLTLCLTLGFCALGGAESADGDAVAEKSFSLRIANASDAEYAYIRCDYYLNGEQLGSVLASRNEGEEDIVISFAESDFASAQNPQDLSTFSAVIYLAYADEDGEQALQDAMQGNPGVETLCGKISFAAQYDREYLYEIVGSAADGYALRSVVKV